MGEGTLASRRRSCASRVQGLTHPPDSIRLTRITGAEGALISFAVAEGFWHCGNHYQTFAEAEFPQAGGMEA